MTTLSVIGILIDILGAIFIVIGLPPKYPSWLLKLRYWFDRNYPPVAQVKSGYLQLVASVDIYQNIDDFINECIDDNIGAPDKELQKCEDKNRCAKSSMEIRNKSKSTQKHKQSK